MDTDPVPESNVPDVYLRKDDQLPEFKKFSCMTYPNFTSIKFNNIHWQVLEGKEATYYFYGAYFDNRYAGAVTV